MNDLVKLNTLKIEEVIAEKGLLKTDVSIKMGMNRSFVSNSLGRGYMKRSNYILLCLVLGVDSSLFIKKRS